jgi:hypothetical protein
LSGIVFIGILVLVFIGLPIGLGLLFYFVPKKFGYPKVGKYLTLGYVLSILLFMFYILIEDQLFTKKEARALVEEQNIKLNDKFYLLNNSSTGALGADYYHKFTLQISAPDRQQAITAIKGSRIFKTDPHLVDSLLYMRNEGRYFGPRVVQDYQTKYAYVREYFQPSCKENYAPTFRRISISKTENELTFEDIAE